MQSYRHRRSVGVLLSTVVVLAGADPPIHPPLPAPTPWRTSCPPGYRAAPAPVPGRAIGRAGLDGHTLQEVWTLPRGDASAAAPARCWPAESRALAAATGRSTAAAGSDVNGGDGLRPLAFRWLTRQSATANDTDLVQSNIKAEVRPLCVSVAATPVPTGQTTRYDTGDDGDLEKGVAWPVHASRTRRWHSDRQPDWLHLAQKADCPNATRPELLQWVSRLAQHRWDNEWQQLQRHQQRRRHQPHWQLPNVRSYTA